MKSKIKINILCSFSCQVITILYGLFIPRLILQCFGSEINGLVASITQLLNYISLLEGGISGVLLAALYKPLNEKDNKKLSAVIKSADTFYKRIGLIIVVYSVAISIIYPLIVKSSFEWRFVASLALIIAIALFIQYYFSLTFRLLIKADQKVYVINIVQIISIVLNCILTVIVLKYFPRIHVLKIANIFAFLIQPIVYYQYARKYYNIDMTVAPDSDALSQRWAGFGQNLAFFIHANTDIVVLTFFSTLASVSVYSVFWMVASALQSLVLAVSAAIVPTLGCVLAGENEVEKNRFFDKYEFGISFITTFVFSCGIILVNSFIKIYTSGIKDTNYNQPIFGALLMLAEAICCLQDPYMNTSYASGHFKQTARYAYAGALINIILSVVLVWKFGLIGVAVGTAVSMVYMMLMHIMYLSKNILHRPVSKWIKKNSNSVIILICCTVFSILFNTTFVNGVITWILYAIVTSIIVFAALWIVNYFTNRELLLDMVSGIIRRESKISKR